MKPTPIEEHGFLSDCRSVALVAADGSIDWCCMPRIDAGSVFGRLLDAERGGHCTIAPTAAAATFRRYRGPSLVLETVIRGEGGEAVLVDCLVMEDAEPGGAHLLRIVEGVRGSVELRITVAPRFDYAEVRPWLRRDGPGMLSAIGGNDALLIVSDAGLEPEGEHDVAATVTVHPGDRVRLSIRFLEPHLLEPPPRAHTPEELDRLLAATERWWSEWAGEGRPDGAHADAALRSAIVLKGLTNRDTGAVAAAATTSLPESPGGGRNWDYRYSWVRDSTLTVRALGDLGFDAEADGFRRFIQRSSAGHVDDLRIAYGVGGERRLTELEIDLAGYGGARPVRVGNAAGSQSQLDVFGELLLLAWRWHRRGHSPDDDHWRFLVGLVDAAAERWGEPDRGIWEMRGRPRHFVHSKAMCWAALDRGLALADECMRRAPVRRWRAARDEVRAAVEKKGYDPRRGVFVQAFGARRTDAALLLLPHTGFVAWDDERMVRTADAVRAELDDDGLLRRYRDAGQDRQMGEEGAFVACSFWLAECFAEQGRVDDAVEVFDRAASAANELGLFSEEYDTRRGTMLGNFPQGLTHLSHVAAAVALSRCEGRVRPVA